MEDVKILNSQTFVQKENVEKEKAKKILFSPVTNIVDDMANQDMDKFSTAYESDKIKSILDKHDLEGYINGNAQMQTANVNQKSFNDLLDSQNNNSVQTEQVVLSKPKMKKATNVKAKLNFRGKLMLAGFCAVAMLFGFLAIFNAVDIKNITNEIETLNTEVSQSESHLGQLWQTYSNLNNINRITTEVDKNGMSLIPTENQIEVELEIKEAQELQKSSNWFDAVCDFLSGLFR